MTSYELSSMILELRAQMEDGIIDEDTFNDTVEGLCIEDKLNGLIYATKRIDSEMEMLQQEKRRLDEELKRQAKNKDKLKGLTEMLLRVSNKNKFEGVAGKLGFRKSSSVEVSQNFIELHRDEEFVIKDINYKVDKKLLKSILESHKAIDGAYIKINNNLQIK